MQKIASQLQRSATFLAPKVQEENQASEKRNTLQNILPQSAQTLESFRGYTERHKVYLAGLQAIKSGWPSKAFGASDFSIALEQVVLTPVSKEERKREKRGKKSTI
jgi:hypothetical protein